MSLLKITLNPALLNVGSPWIQAPDSAFKPPDAFQAVGMMPVQLPDESTIKSLRITGRREAGSLFVGLNRENVTSVSAPEGIVGVNDPPIGEFDQTEQAPDPALNTVNNENFRYFLVAAASVGLPTNVTIALYAFQIACEVED